MTIQPSVLIWTVICFCLAMLILDRLLFRPLFAVMDARRARIDAAREKREEARRALEEAQAEAERRSAERAGRAEAERLRQLAEGKARAEAALSQAEAAQLRRLDDCRGKLGEERAALSAKLSQHIDALAEQFAGRLLS